MGNTEEARGTLIESIVQLFISDTIELLDLVLWEKDMEKPEHSANTVWSRFEMAMTYYAKSNETPLPVSVYLQESGYPQEAIDVLIYMCKKEKEFHKKLCEEQNLSTHRYDKETPGW